MKEAVGNNFESQVLEIAQSCGYVTREQDTAQFRIFGWFRGRKFRPDIVIGNGRAVSYRSGQVARRHDLRCVPDPPGKAKKRRGSADLRSRQDFPQDSGKHQGICRRAGCTPLLVVQPQKRTEDITGITQVRKPEWRLTATTRFTMGMVSAVPLLPALAGPCREGRTPGRGGLGCGSGRGTPAGRGSSPESREEHRRSGSPPPEGRSRPSSHPARQPGFQPGWVKAVN